MLQNFYHHMKVFLYGPQLLLSTLRTLLIHNARSKRKAHELSKYYVFQILRRIFDGKPPTVAIVNNIWVIVLALGLEVDPTTMILPIIMEVFG